MDELNDQIVQDILMSVLLSPIPSDSLEYTNNNERNRGGDKRDVSGQTQPKFISERTMDMLLREMRKLDRDRDRVLHPIQIKTLFAKYKVKCYK